MGLSRDLRIAAVATGAVANILTSVYYSSMQVVEQEGMWTVRLWFTTWEKYIYTLGALVITAAFVLDVWALALYRGESVDASVLFLSVEVGIFLTGVLYQAHRTHILRLVMYKAWSGPSRTTWQKPDAWVNSLSGAKASWWKEAIARAERSQVGHIHPTESRLNLANVVSRWTKRTWCDVTAVMSEAAALRPDKQAPRPPGVGLQSSIAFDVHADVDVDSPSIRYYPFTHGNSMSLLWGSKIGQSFQSRVSRGILTYEAQEINSAFSVGRADRKRSAMIARGILARTKGVAPRLLWFRKVYNTATVNVEYSPHKPRPSKTNIKIFHQDMEKESDGIGSPFVNAATELALLTVDIPSKVVTNWLDETMEQQDYHWSWTVQRFKYQADVDVEAGNLAVEAMYRLQYVLMLLSLNMGTRRQSLRSDLRPEALVMIVWAKREPSASAVQRLLTLNEQTLSDRLDKELAWLATKEDVAHFVAVTLFYLGWDDNSWTSRVREEAVEMILQFCRRID